MQLQELLADVDVLDVVGDVTVDVRSLAHDSRRVEAGACFACIVGSNSDGHEHAPEALAAGAVALCAVVLIPPLGLGAPHTEHTAFALVLVGITIVVLRRPILFQLIGLVVAENGLSLLAVSVPGGLSYVVEFGALFDLALIVTVAAAFAQRIHTDLGTGDTELLRGLRD